MPPGRGGHTHKTHVSVDAMGISFDETKEVADCSIEVISFEGGRSERADNLELERPRRHFCREPLQIFGQFSGYLEKRDCVAHPAGTGEFDPSFCKDLESLDISLSVHIRRRPRGMVDPSVRSAVSVLLRRPTEMKLKLCQLASLASR